MDTYASNMSVLSSWSHNTTHDIRADIHTHSLPVHTLESKSHTLSAEQKLHS